MRETPMLRWGSEVSLEIPLGGEGDVVNIIELRSSWAV